MLGVMRLYHAIARRFSDIYDSLTTCKSHFKHSPEAGVLMKKNHVMNQSMYPVEFTRKFENIQCRIFSVVLLAVLIFFLFPYTVDTISTTFALSDYRRILSCTVSYALLIIVVAAFAKIEKQDLTAQTLGLSLQIPKELKKIVLTFVFLFFISGVSILAFFFYMKFRGIDIHLINPNPLLIPWTEEADWDEKLRTIFFFIIPHSVSVLLFAPFIEEAYFTGLIFPALRNRLGFVLGVTLTAFLFSYHHYSPFSEGQLREFIIIFMSQSLSFFLYQFTRSLYPSIAFHFLRNMSVLSLELSAFI